MNHLAEIEIIKRPRFHEIGTLERMRSALEILKLDHPSFRWIHIAGSKGKGSIATVLSQVLQDAGYKTGLYTSPHIMNIRERIMIQSEPVDTQLFNATYQEIQTKLPASLFGELTFFELMTLLAVCIFHEKKVDTAVIETGLGGRLDATNAICNPSLTIITPIELEHTQKLGNTLEEIAGEKAGIIREHTPVLMAKQTLEVSSVMQNEVSRRNSKLYSFDQLAFVKRYFDRNQPYENFTLNSGITGSTYTEVKLQPLGLHQVQNASVVILGSELLAKAGFILSEKSFRHSLKTVSLPCRYEYIESKQKTFLLDGAHTYNSSFFLATTFQERNPGIKIPIVFGSKHNKNVMPILKNLLPICSTFCFTKVPEIHSYEPDVLQSMVRELQFKGEVRLFDAQADPHAIYSFVDTTLLVTGSLILGGYYRAYFLTNRGV